MKLPSSILKQIFIKLLTAKKFSKLPLGFPIPHSNLIPIAATVRALLPVKMYVPPKDNNSCSRNRAGLIYFRLLNAIYRGESVKFRATSWMKMAGMFAAINQFEGEALRLQTIPLYLQRIVPVWNSEKQFLGDTGFFVRERTRKNHSCNSPEFSHSPRLLVRDFAWAWAEGKLIPDRIFRAKRRFQLRSVTWEKMKSVPPRHI